MSLSKLQMYKQTSAKKKYLIELKTNDLELDTAESESQQLDDLSAGKNVTAVDPFITAILGSEPAEFSGMSPRQIPAEEFEAMEADCNDGVPVENKRKTTGRHEMVECMDDVFAANQFDETAKSQMTRHSICGLPAAALSLSAPMASASSTGGPSPFLSMGSLAIELEEVRGRGEAEICNEVLGIRDLFLLFFSFSHYSERKALSQIHGSETETWAVCANHSLKKYEFAGRVPKNAAIVYCKNEELPQRVAQMTQSFVAYLPQCVLCFARGGAKDVWVVAKFCDETHAAAFGWKQHAADCTQRNIASSICELPTVRCEEQWVATVSAAVDHLDESNGSVAVGMRNCGMVLLDAATGYMSEKLNGRHVAFVGNKVIGVSPNRIYEHSDNTLLNEVPMDAESIRSVKASPKGKSLFVRDNCNKQLREYRTSNWQLTASGSFIGQPFGHFDIGSNGVLAQGIRREDGSHCIELMECNTRCVTQTIRTLHTVGIRQVSFSPDSTRIVSVSFDGSAQLFDASNGQLIGEPRYGHMGKVTSVCWLTTEWFVTVSSDASIVIWHIDSQKPALRIANAHNNWITYVHRTSAHSFVTGSWDKSVKKWRIAFDSADKH